MWAKLRESSVWEQCPRRLQPVSFTSNRVGSTMEVRLACDFCGTGVGRLCIGGEEFPCSGDKATVRVAMFVVLLYLFGADSCIGLHSCGS